MTGCSCRFYWFNHIHCHTFESYILSWNWRYRYSVHPQTSCYQLDFFTRFAKFVYFSSHLRPDERQLNPFSRLFLSEMSSLKRWETSTVYKFQLRLDIV